jgi:uncharacterized protein (DUF488 family)
LADVLTIGAYGWDEERFFAALQTAGVEVFCDVRRRRGVRGSEYAFVNSVRLQQRLGELGIAYVHRVDLAPSTEVRRAQYVVDAAAGVGKRARTQLSDAFVQAYDDECLRDFEPEAFLADVGADRRVVLFCVEGEPTACHRGLVADRLAAAGAQVTHLTP